MTPQQPDWKVYPLLDLVLAVQAAGAARSPEREELCHRLHRIAATCTRRKLKRLGCGRHDVEDATQVVLIHLDRVAGKYDPTRASPKTFFRLVAARKLSTWVNRRARDRLVTGLDTAALVDHRSGTRQEATKLPRDLPPLPPVLRLYFRRRTQGRTTTEIAFELQMTPATLRQSVSRALREIRSRLSGS